MAVLVTPMAFIFCYLRLLRISMLPLLQASGLRVDRVADRITGHEKFHSPVLLSTCRVIIRSNSQSVAKASSRDGIGRDSLSHQVVTHRAGAVLRQGLIHLIAAHVVGVSADFDIESRVGEQDTGNF